jgi:hypothetical protein
VPVVQLSPSRVRSPEAQVMGEALADDARTATPPRGVVENVVTSPPVADARMGTPPRVAEVVGTLAGDDGATTSPMIIDADPIRTDPGEGEDLVGDQPQVDLAPGGPETSGAQVPPSSSSSPRLPRRTINWNRTPWQEDWFEDNEDRQALRTSIVTINNALLTDKTRIHLRSASVRTYTFFTTEFRRFLSIRGARGLLALNQVLI